MRLSRMISSARAGVAAPMPSKVSARPSSCSAPVRAMVAASARRTATGKGRAVRCGEKDAGAERADEPADERIVARGGGEEPGVAAGTGMGRRVRKAVASARTAASWRRRGIMMRGRASAAAGARRTAAADRGGCRRLSMVKWLTTQEPLSRMGSARPDVKAPAGMRLIRGGLLLTCGPCAGQTLPLAGVTKA